MTYLNRFHTLRISLMHILISLYKFVFSLTYFYMSLYIFFSSLYMLCTSSTHFFSHNVFWFLVIFYYLQYFSAIYSFFNYPSMWDIFFLISLSLSSLIGLVQKKTLHVDQQAWQQWEVSIIEAKASNCAWVENGDSMWCKKESGVVW